MKKLILASASLFIIIFMYSCNSKKYDEQENLKKEFHPLKLIKLAQSGTSSSDYQKYKQSRKITKNGYIKFKRNDLEKCKKYTDSLLKKYHSSLISEKYEKSYYGTYNFQLNIPAGYFETFIKDLQSQFGKPETINISLEDFTESYYDIDSRLKSKKAYIDKCLELLKKAKKINDLLEIEEKISDVQEDIDRLSGSLVKKDYQIKFYFLNIDFITDEFKKDNESPGFFKSIIISLEEGWNLTLNIILGFVSIWPILLILITAFFLIRKFIKKSQKK
ncbi:MAG: DUF4349 domain-containing protein [bacterium]